MAETFLALKPFIVATLGGVAPALIWLWFWLQQDEENPEPRGLIGLSFVGGMFVVFFVLPVQQLIAGNLAVLSDGIRAILSSTSTEALSNATIQTTLWAGAEEVGKFAVMFFLAFRSKFFNEPLLDPVMYMITAALGFAAMENMLYILKDLPHASDSVILLGVSMRFIGATTLHVVSSAIVGLALAAAFYWAKPFKAIAVTCGLLAATLLHAYFNLSIMKVHGTLNTISVFVQFWFAVVVIIILIHFIKSIHNPKKETPNLS